MKFLIDECLSPALVEIARGRGHLDSTHVNWIGLGGATDWTISRRAVDEGFVFATSNRLDFLKLYKREELHAGLLCLNCTQGTLNREQQRRLFALVVGRLEDVAPYNEVLELSLELDGEISLVRYFHPGPP